MNSKRNRTAFSRMTSENSCSVSWCEYWQTEHYHFTSCWHRGVWLP